MGRPARRGKEPPNARAEPRADGGFHEKLLRVSRDLSFENKTKSAITIHEVYANVFDVLGVVESLSAEHALAARELARSILRTSLRDVDWIRASTPQGSDVCEALKSVIKVTGFFLHYAEDFSMDEREDVLTALRLVRELHEAARLAWTAWRSKSNSEEADREKSLAILCMWAVGTCRFRFTSASLSFPADFVVRGLVDGEPVSSKGLQNEATHGFQMLIKYFPPGLLTKSELSTCAKSLLRNLCQENQAHRLFASTLEAVRVFATNSQRATSTMKDVLSNDPATWLLVDEWLVKGDSKRVTQSLGALIALFGPLLLTNSRTYLNHLNRFAAAFEAATSVQSQHRVLGLRNWRDMIKVFAPLIRQQKGWSKSKATKTLLKPILDAFLSHAPDALAVRSEGLRTWIYMTSVLNPGKVDADFDAAWSEFTKPFVLALGDFSTAVRAEACSFLLSWMEGKVSPEPVDSQPNQHKGTATALTPASSWPALCAIDGALQVMLTATTTAYDEDDSINRENYDVVAEVWKRAWRTQGQQVTVVGVLTYASKPLELSMALSKHFTSEEREFGGLRHVTRILEVLIKSERFKKYLLLPSGQKEGEMEKLLTFLVEIIGGGPGQLAEADGGRFSWALWFLCARARPVPTKQESEAVWLTRVLIPVEQGWRVDRAWFGSEDVQMTWSMGLSWCQKRWDGLERFSTRLLESLRANEEPSSLSLQLCLLVVERLKADQLDVWIDWIIQFGVPTVFVSADETWSRLFVRLIERCPSARRLDLAKALLYKLEERGRDVTSPYFSNSVLPAALEHLLPRQDQVQWTDAVWRLAFDAVGFGVSDAAERVVRARTVVFWNTRVAGRANRNWSVLRPQLLQALEKVSKEEAVWGLPTTRHAGKAEEERARSPVRDEPPPRKVVKLHTSRTVRTRAEVVGGATYTKLDDSQDY